MRFLQNGLRLKSTVDQFDPHNVAALAGQGRAAAESSQVRPELGPEPAIFAFLLPCFGTGKIFGDEMARVGERRSPREQGNRARLSAMVTFSSTALSTS